MEMGQITEVLDNIISSTENTERLYKIFESIGNNELPIIKIQMDKGHPLIRQRINNKGEDFTKISDLYCPPAHCLKEYGRANIPYKPMFYACCFSMDSTAYIPRMITLMETSSFLRNKESSGIERATFSKWCTNSKLELLVLPFSKHYKKACKDIIYIQELWKSQIEKQKTNEKAKELIDYMSNEISKHFSSSNEYFKIANFINYLLYINEETKKADGIIYPSVYAEGNGFNIAIKKESADKKLDFIGASKCYLIKRKDISWIITANHSSTEISDGILTYIPKEYSKEEFLEIKSLTQGLDFIN